MGNGVMIRRGEKGLWVEFHHEWKGVMDVREMREDNRDVVWALVGRWLDENVGPDTRQNLHANLGLR